jgi:ATP-dependent helicase HrpA
LKFLKKNLALTSEAEKAAAYFGGRKKVEARIFDRVIEELFSRPFRSKEEFLVHAASCVNRILPAGRIVSDSIMPVVYAYASARERIGALEKATVKGPVIGSFLNDIRNSLTRIVPENFIEICDVDRMLHLCRYVRAMILRAERGVFDLEKDRKKAARIKPFTDTLDSLIKELNASASKEKKDAVEELVWMIEEFKVSLFAQELKTAFPVSPKKIEDKIREIQRMV